MNTSILLLVLALIGISSYVLGKRRAAVLAGARSSNMHSRSGYHGSYVLIWALIPSALILALWLVVSPLVINSAVHASFPEDIKAQPEAQQSLTYGMVTSIARGLKQLSSSEYDAVKADPATARTVLASKGVAIAGDPQPYMIEAAEKLNTLTSTSRIAMALVVLLAALGGAFHALRAIAPRFRARNRVEQVILGALLVASSIAILTTIGIVMSMLTEAIQFFQMVPAHQFFFGTVWDPRFAAAGSTDSSGQFGLIPLLAGTLYIGFVAMLVAVPVGLFSAIYMAEYASPRLRSIAKPLLEVLAGIPTIVYGFFALTTVGPFLRDISAQINGLATGNYASFIQAQSVITAGFVMGIMLILTFPRCRMTSSPPCLARFAMARWALCHPLRDGQEGHSAGRSSRHRRRDPDDRFARHRRNHDRGSGRWCCRPPATQPLRAYDNRDRQDRQPADGRP